jgi:predicted PurR-regulated permease PerM
MNHADNNFQKNAMSAAIQIGAVFVVIMMCYQIISPFIGLVAWAMIIAVALYPVHLTLTAILGGRGKLSATVFSLVGLAVLLVPVVNLADSSIHSLQTLSAELDKGTITIPPPDASVADWPLIGEKLHTAWANAASNLEETLNQFTPQLQAMGKWTLRFIGSSTLGVLQFVISIIIAGVFLVSADGGYRLCKNIARSLSEKHGDDMIDMAVATIRSVAKGVLGVAFIQAFLSAIGLAVMDVPAAGVWTVLILVLAIIQLPPLLVLGPIAVWVFSVADTTPATLFAIYAGIVSLSDSFLKPLFLGRGMDIPMLVILLGAIGGAMLSGIIGLFTGAVTLAVGYKLLVAWMVTEEAEDTGVPSAEEAAGAS